jgi:ribosomal protein S12 methylthiotransferase
MRENPKVCKYVDMPLQHIANPVLKNMMRHVTREETEALIKRIKEEVPGVVLRTTMLVGFPGETQVDFEELKQFIIDTKFERLGVFPFSNEEGTYAHKHFSDDVPEDEKQQRADEIMEIQQQISADLNQQKIGKTYKVLIDKKEGEFYVGRTEFDSPEVDGEVLITSENTLKNGDFVNVKITGSEDYDLYGEVV